MEPEHRNPAYLKQRAREIRLRAHLARDQVARADMMEVADWFDRLARVAEDRLD